MVQRAGSVRAAVIGTGLMGSALAHALSKGCTVSVWNRTLANALPLAEHGMTVAADAAAAMAASDIVVVCVAHLAAVQDILASRGVREALRGKLVLNYTSGAAADVRAIRKMVEDAGGRYVHGAILVYPSDIGSAESDIVHSGEKRAYDDNLATIRLMANKASFIGEEVAAACLVERAMFTFYYGCVLSFFQGAAVLETEGVPLQHFATAAKNLQPVVADTIDQALRMIASGDYSGQDSHLDVHRTAAEGAYEDAVASGVSTEILSAIRGMIRKGIDRAGGIHNELPVIYQAFRPEGR